jgi:hypothetical protein
MENILAHCWIVHFPAADQEQCVFEIDWHSMRNAGWQRLDQEDSQKQAHIQLRILLEEQTLVV